MKKCFVLLIGLLCLKENEAKHLKRPTKTKICVIGAGPAGLSTTGYLARHLDKFDITVFERAHEVGGQWLYTDNIDVDNYGYPVHSGIYKYLRTNSPKEITNFPDWPVFKGDNNSYVSHELVLGYLKNYTDYFHLRKFIKLNTIVLNVSLIKEKELEQWKVTFKSLKTFQIRTSIFDAVIVCNGRFSEPKVPTIPGLENFKGQVLHSHSYRKPDMFKDKTVIILGGMASGVDIGQELLNVSSKVYLSHKYPKLPVKGFIQVKGIDKFENKSFVLTDNSSISADVLILCTGYKFSFPFLDKSTEIEVNDNYVYPLYKQIFNVEHPTMSFVGIPRGRYSVFPFFSVQVQSIIAMLEGQMKLPPKSEMLKDAESNKLKKLYTPLELWRYLDELASFGGFSAFPSYYKSGTELSVNHTRLHLDDYKNYNLLISPDQKSVKMVKLNVTRNIY